jgi:hypothetical protein
MRVRSRLAVLAVLGAGLAATAPSALAAACTRTWDGGAGTAEWATAANWDANTLPGPADIVCLGGDQVDHLTGTTAVLAIQGGSGQLRVLGGTLSLTSATEPSSFTGAVVVSGELRIAGPATAGEVVLNGGTLRIDGGTGVLTATRLGADAGTVTGSGALHAVPPAPTFGGIEKGASGTLTIDVATLDASRVSANGGTLVLASPGWSQLSGGTLSGELIVGSTATVQTMQPITTVAAAGRLELFGNPTVSTGSGPWPQIPATIAGVLSLHGGTHVVASLDVLNGGRAFLDGTELSAATAVVRANGTLWGVEDSDPGLTVATPLKVEGLGRLYGSLRITGDVEVAGMLEPRSVFVPAIEVSGSFRMTATATQRVTLFGSAPDDVDRVAIGGQAQLSGALEVWLPNPTTFVPPVGTEWVIATFASSAGQHGTVILPPPGTFDGRSLALKATATDLRVVVVAAGPPKLLASRVGLVGTAGRVSVEVDVDLNQAASLFAQVQYGPTTAYGSTTRTVTQTPIGGDPQRVTVRALISLTPGTHHARLVAASAYGQTIGPDLTIVVPDPPPPTPPAPPTPNPLDPVAAIGTRTFAATRLRTGALRVPFAYRLVRPCATPCKARVELRLRSGKQLFAAGLAGDGKVLVTRKDVTLKAGANALRVDVPKAKLRGVRWTPSGRRYQTVKVRLRVVLPQADGRELVTVRDGLLRVLRPRPAPR